MFRTISQNSTMVAAARCLRLGLLLAAILGSLSGCGSGSKERASAGPVTYIADDGTSGTLTALVIGQTVKLSMSPSNDVTAAGVDWKVKCGGNPTTGSITNGACGTFSQVHAANGSATAFSAPSAVPIGNTVTITATVTTNPSQSSSLTVTVVPLPVAISFALTPPPSLQVNAITAFAAKVTNDSEGNGVIWSASCGALACGSFNPTTTASQGSAGFTAPSVVPNSGTVTITATSLTDTTKSISAAVTITPVVAPPPPPIPTPISLSVIPSNISVQATGAGRVGTLTAVVLNDTTNAGVDWTLTCSATSCGSISAHTASGSAASFLNTSGLATGGTITIRANSKADPTKAAVATATVVSTAPLTATISKALPASLTAGAQATIAATTTAAGGVDWSATCGSAGACGSFNLSPAHTSSAGQIVYTAPTTVPSGATVAITATPTTTSPANGAVTTTTVVAAPPPPLTLSFSQAPPSKLASATGTAVAMTVTNDVAPGGVSWSAQCSSAVAGGCGWFNPTQTASGATTVYTAPPVTAAGSSVTLVATSIGKTSVMLGSSPIAITPDPVAVQFIPGLPAQMQVDQTVSVTAAVANDTTQAGVDWQVCASGCGFFTVKPSIPAHAATATTPYIPAVPAVTATSVQAWPNGLPIPYTAPSQPTSNGQVGLAASAHVDTTKANSGTIAIRYAAGTPAIAGSVQAGGQPVAGASVALYTTGTKGYGSAATQVASSVVTGTGGGFTIPSGFACPQANSQMYLVASGGAVGKLSANPNLVLMTALGGCASLISGAVVVNEVTTVASAFALAPFGANDALNGNSSYLYLGTSSANLTGLANAFAAVHNLVDITTGTVRFTVPAGNAAVPYVEIDTVADMIHACAATAGGVEGDGSNCSILFKGTDLLGTGTYASSIAPGDTLQAAFNMAQHPVSNYGYTLENDGDHPLLTLATAASPFQPILTAKPHDWSVSLTYTGGGGLTTSSTVGSFAIDGSGNLWITDSKAGTAIEWNPVGAAISPASGYTAGGAAIVVDANNNPWISGNGAVTVLTPLGDPQPWSPIGGVPGGGSDAAFDRLGNLWIASGNGVQEFNNLGVEISPITGFTIQGMTNVTALGIDNLSNVWVGAGDGTAVGYFAQMTDPGGQVVVDTSATALRYQPQMAADGKGEIWAIKPGISICVYKPYAGSGSTLNESCYATGGSTGVSATVNVVNPRGLAADGAGTVWAAAQGDQTVPPGVLPIVPGSERIGSSMAYRSDSLAAGPLRVAIDGSGNVWVLLSNNTVTEYVGAATPAVTPLALGAKNNKFGATP